MKRRRERRERIESILLLVVLGIIMGIPILLPRHTEMYTLLLIDKVWQYLLQARKGIREEGVQLLIQYIIIKFICIILNWLLTKDDIVSIRNEQKTLYIKARMQRQKLYILESNSSEVDVAFYQSRRDRYMEWSDSLAPKSRVRYPRYTTFTSSNGMSYIRLTLTGSLADIRILVRSIQDLVGIENVEENIDNLPSNNNQMDNRKTTIDDNHVGTYKKTLYVNPSVGERLEKAQDMIDRKGFQINLQKIIRLSDGPNGKKRYKTITASNGVEYIPVYLKGSDEDVKKAVGLIYKQVGIANVEETKEGTTIYIKAPARRNLKIGTIIKKTPVYSIDIGRTTVRASNGETYVVVHIKGSEEAIQKAIMMIQKDVGMDNVVETVELLANDNVREEEEKEDEKKELPPTSTQKASSTTEQEARIEQKFYLQPSQSHILTGKQGRKKKKWIINQSGVENIQVDVPSVPYSVYVVHITGSTQAVMKAYAMILEAVKRENAKPTQTPSMAVALDTNTKPQSNKKQPFILFGASNIRHKEIQEESVTEEATASELFKSPTAVSVDVEEEDVPPYDQSQAAKDDNNQLPLVDEKGDRLRRAKRNRIQKKRGQNDAVTKIRPNITSNTAPVGENESNTHQDDSSKLIVPTSQSLEQVNINTSSKTDEEPTVKKDSNGRKAVHITDANEPAAPLAVPLNDQIQARSEIGSNSTESIACDTSISFSMNDGSKASKAKALSTFDMNDNDPLLTFLRSQHQCIKGSVDEFYTWLVKSKDIDSMIALQEAVNEDEYLNNRIKNGNGSSGLKGFKIPPFKRAVLAYDNTKVFEEHQLTREPPDELVCPISLTLMSNDPVVAADGITYERESIEDWFQKSNEKGSIIYSPVHGTEMKSLILTPNIGTRNMARAFKDER